MIYKSSNLQRRMDAASKHKALQQCARMAGRMAFTLRRSDAPAAEQSYCDALARLKDSTR